MKKIILSCMLLGSFCFGEGLSFEYMEKLCIEGKANTCAFVANVYKSDKDYKTANDFYQKGCDGGDILSCYNLGYPYYSGEGIKHDYKKASELYKKSCDGGLPYGCYNLGNMYEKGQGVEQDYEKARYYFKKNCDTGDTFGCDRYEKIK